MAYRDVWGYGNGIFGEWVEDRAGAAAYRYTLDQARDPRGAHFTTLGPSTDQWHQIGNDRLTATAHVEGYVQVYDWSRGGKLLNRWQVERQRYGGGFSWIGAEGVAFPTLWSQLPTDARQERIFGQNYFEKTTRWRDWVIQERIEAPEGDLPFLRHGVTVRNEGTETGGLIVIPYWEGAMHQLTVAGLNPPWLARFCTWLREKKNNRFTLETRYNATLHMLSAEYVAKFPQHLPNQATGFDEYPKSIFFAMVSGPEEALTGACGDGGAFFDAGGTPGPGMEGRADGALLEGPHEGTAHGSLALRFQLSLAPGASTAISCVYGYTEGENIPLWLQAARDPACAPTPPAPRATCRFEGGPPWLGRELAWHAAYFQGGTYYHDYFQAHFVDQGSAYTYLHGASGAPRDYALFILPMVYLRPALAKDMLRFLFRTQKTSGKFPYAHVGNGLLRGYGVHSFSSDLDLFVIWAAAEYLGATRDWAFLEEEIPCYSRARATGTALSVLDHLKAAFEHLSKVVGTGPNGLIRSRTGDWNDVFMAFSPFPPLTVLRGESALNGSLAALALPALARVVEGRDRAFAEALRRYGAAQTKAIEGLWTGDWLARGYLGFLGKTLGEDRLFLDTQAFPVLAGLWDHTRRERLFNAIQRRCVDAQRVGATALDPPMTGLFLQPGSDTNGGVWAAIDSLVAWAWLLHDPEAAWTFFKSTTLAARAEAYPEVWYGVWSGPDAYNAHYHERPGETFSHNFTPMTNFPVMNMNRHSAPLLVMAKAAGFGWDGDRIVVAPRIPEAEWRLEMGLMGAAYTPAHAEGYYQPQCAGSFAFAIAPPRDNGTPRLEVNGVEWPFERNREGAILFEATGSPEQIIRWRME